MPVSRSAVSYMAMLQVLIVNLAEQPNLAASAIAVSNLQGLAGSEVKFDCWTAVQCWHCCADVP